MAHDFLAVAATGGTKAATASTGKQDDNVPAGSGALYVYCGQ